MSRANSAAKPLAMLALTRRALHLLPHGFAIVCKRCYALGAAQLGVSI